MKKTLQKRRIKTLIWIMVYGSEMWTIRKEDIYKEIEGLRKVDLAEDGKI